MINREDATQHYTPHTVKQPSQPLVRINGYKLFFQRASKKLTFTDLSRKSGIDRELLRKLEKVNERSAPADVSWFQPCDLGVLDKLEETLGRPGHLQAGKDDDFLTQYVLFYAANKGAGKGRREGMEQLPLAFPTKVVVFDFEGTLTLSSDNRTFWEKLWQVCGYSVEDCSRLHIQFQRHKFSHQEWCDLTCAAFRNGKTKLHENHVMEIARGIRLVDGVSDTIQTLVKRGIQVRITSGSITSIIRHVLGPELHAKFTEIKANEMVFDASGTLSEIKGTSYDFEGKAAFLRRAMEECKASPYEALFVGNSCNDIYASQSGARTLCVNPRLTDPSDEKRWTYAISDMQNLTEILKYVATSGSSTRLAAEDHGQNGGPPGDHGRPSTAAQVSSPRDQAGDANVLNVFPGGERNSRFPAKRAPPRATRDELLERLSQALPAQFEKVVFRAQIATEYLPQPTAPQASQAIAVIRYFEQQKQLDELAGLLDEVCSGK